MNNLQFHSSYPNNTTTTVDLNNKKTSSHHVEMNKKNVKVETIQTAANNVSAQTDAVNRTMNYDTTPTPNKTTNRKDSYYQDQKQWVSTEPNESTTIDDEIQQRHIQQLFDKKKKRRDSHNAVERRRRDNINERIFELSTLLPERDVTKNNKGTILSKSVDHIRLLHDKLNQYQQRVQELENMLEMYRMKWGDLVPIQQQQQQK